MGTNAVRPGGQSAGLPLIPATNRHNNVTNSIQAAAPGAQRAQRASTARFRHTLPPLQSAESSTHDINKLEPSALASGDITPSRAGAINDTGGLESHSKLLAPQTTRVARPTHSEETSSRSKHSLTRRWIADLLKTAFDAKKSDIDEITSIENDSENVQTASIAEKNAYMHDKASVVKDALLLKWASSAELASGNANAGYTPVKLSQNPGPVDAYAMLERLVLTTKEVDLDMDGLADTVCNVIYTDFYDQSPVSSFAKELHAGQQSVETPATGDQQLVAVLCGNVKDYIRNPQNTKMVLAAYNDIRQALVACLTPCNVIQ